MKKQRNSAVKVMYEMTKNGELVSKTSKLQKAQTWANKAEANQYVKVTTVK
jgi:hypothetical protein